MIKDDGQVVCDRCNGEVKVEVHDGMYYAVCGCGTALNLGSTDEHWIPEKWK